MTEFKIEKGVPVPPADKGVYRKYPLRDMAVGDSFHVQPEPGESVADCSRRLHSVVHSHKRRNGGKYITRRTETGARVWRIE